MKLSYDGIKDTAAWEEAGINLPSYDPQLLSERTKADPVWVHFGIGNIFRIFIGGIADTLIENGELDRGIICAETFDYEVVDRIYDPFDNLVLAVTLHEDGRTEQKVLGSLCEAVKAGAPDRTRRRLAEVFRSPGLQMVSLTITEKGYAMRGAYGSWLPYVQADLENGPQAAAGAMGILTAMLLERYRERAYPIAIVSMDNVSANGRRLRECVLETAKEWKARGYVDGGFLAYVSNENWVSFPWTMIDKITPRPGEEVYRMLTDKGVEDMEPVVTSRHTYIAPYANAKAPQYLVVEDNFPNGRPPLEKAGVYMTDRETVNRSERMKVTVCLNPIHTALCTFACMFRYTLFADSMHDPQLSALAQELGYQEGLRVVKDPGILSPRAFLDEVLNIRFPNPYLGDTSARIAVDISQMVGIRFGETIKAYVEKDGTAAGLTAIPLAIAGWLRYLLAVDDRGEPFVLSPDPMIPQLQQQLEGVTFGDPGSLKDQAKPILSNAHIFGTDLYQAGLGKKIESMLRSMLVGPGAVRETLMSYLE